MTSARARIAFQGAAGAFSEDAIRAFWGADVATLPCRTFSEMLASVRNGQADGAVLPVENAVVGRIHSALDALDDFSDGLALGETVDVPVVHALLGLRGSTLQEIRLVTSHPVALAQCRRFLQAFGARVEPFFDTAGAARMVSEQRDPSIAAVAGRTAATMYGLDVLSDAIQDDPDNWTRFVRIEAGR
ncbi:MAG TPA: prephenate dehydratase domain-containing protein [Gemmatimonadaceae bacterium]|nr:prephenate dehydratase domain-containing protein [Gemmatimonadaceae bacterium]